MHLALFILLKRSKTVDLSLGIHMAKCSFYLHLNKCETVKRLFLTVTKVRSKHTDRNPCAALQSEEKQRVTCLSYKEIASQGMFMK